MGILVVGLSPHVSSLLIRRFQLNKSIFRSPPSNAFSQKEQTLSPMTGSSSTKIFPVLINLCRISFERFDYFTTPPKALHVVFPSPSIQNRQDVSFHMVVPWICIAISKSQVICRKGRNHSFWQFFVSLLKLSSNNHRSANIETKGLAHHCC